LKSFVEHEFVAKELPNLLPDAVTLDGA